MTADQLFAELVARLTRHAEHPDPQDADVFTLPDEQMRQLADVSTRLALRLSVTDPFMRGDARCAYCTAVGLTTAAGTLLSIVRELAE